MAAVCLLCMWCCLVAQEAGPAPAGTGAAAPAEGEKPWEREGAQAGEEATGPDGGTYVWVPAGGFTMGSEDGHEDAKPVHRVRITSGFWLGQCEVTNAQYRRFCDATGREFPTESDQGDDHPVVWVSWHGAQAYCEHYGLRLPTEAEWEYAARGSEGRLYPWGDEWDAGKCCDGDNQGPGGHTYPVGSFPAGVSWCGALDLAGNVLEWCWDWYGAGYYGESPGADPQGPTADDYRVLRGGSWNSFDEASCRSTCRGGSPPSYGYYTDAYRGFRCARTP